jgi:hypothetical protein
MEGRTTGAPPSFRGAMITGANANDMEDRERAL